MKLEMMYCNANFIWCFDHMKKGSLCCRMLNHEVLLGFFFYLCGDCYVVNY
jgi:hypothetical protein